MPLRFPVLKWARKPEPGPARPVAQPSPAPRPKPSPAAQPSPARLAQAQPSQPKHSPAQPGKRRWGQATAEPSPAQLSLAQPSLAQPSPGLAKAVPKPFSYRIQRSRSRPPERSVFGAFLARLGPPCRCVWLFWRVHVWCALGAPKCRPAEPSTPCPSPAQPQPAAQPSLSPAQPSEASAGGPGQATA